MLVVGLIVGTEEDVADDVAVGEEVATDDAEAVEVGDTSTGVTDGVGVLYVQVND